MMGAHAMASTTARPTDPLSTRILAAVALAGLVLATFAPLLADGRAFVLWDDDVNIVGNPFLRQLDVDSIGWAFRTNIIGVYEPLSWIVKCIEAQVFGLTPRAFHATSLAMHLGTALLLLLLARRVLARALPAAPAASILAGATVAAALWAVHPLRTEVVAWASGQSYAQAGLFSVAAALAYARRCEAPSGGAGWLVASILLYGCAVLSKSAAVMLPAALVALDLFPYRRLGSLRTWIEKIPFGVVAVVMMYVAWAATATTQPTDDVALDAGQKIARAGHAVVTYLMQCVWPVDLLPHYRLPDGGVGLGQPRFAAATAVALALCIAAAVQLRRRPGPALAWFVYLATLLPVLGFVQHGIVTLGFDRYTHLSTLPLLVVLGGGAARLAQRCGARAVLAGTACLCLLLAWQTHRQLGIWHDTDALWQHTLDVDPGNGFAANNLGHHRMQQGRHAEAESLLRQGYDAGDHSIRLVLNLGVTLEKQQRLDEAATLYEANVSRHPDSAALHHNLALVYLKLERPRPAVAALERTLALDPAFPGAAERLRQVRALMAQRQRGAERSVK